MFYFAFYLAPTVGPHLQYLSLIWERLIILFFAPCAAIPMRGHERARAKLVMCFMVQLYEQSVWGVNPSQGQGDGGQWATISWAAQFIKL